MTIRGIVNGLNIQHGERMILKKAKAEIPRGARIAVIGRNGAGKSSLLEAIAAGAAGVEWIGGIPSISYMRQEEKAFSETDKAESRRLKSRWNVPEREDGLSGGEGMKRRLAQALTAEAELLILDEPTNHLDADSVRQLTEKLKKLDGILLFVSHDRQFIDELATHVWEIEHGSLTAYTGNYSESRKEKEHHRLTQQRNYEKQQKKIEKVEKQIAELQSWSGKAHAESTKQEGFKEFYRKKAKRMDTQIRSKRKRLIGELEKETAEKPEEDRPVRFDMKAGAKKGKRIIELRNAEKRIGSRILFTGASLTIQHGERVGLVGPNGSGKSTLFAMIRGETDYSGEVWCTAGMKIGFLSQDVFDLPEDKTPAELFGAQDFKESGRIRTLMDRLGFEQSHWKQPVEKMSMGERVKLKLMEFMLTECDVLMLDEPTNHLDLPSREQLENTLKTFPGTLLIATHDRYFMERLADRLLLFEPGRLAKFAGSYTDWLASKEEKPKMDLLQLETEQQAVLGKLSFMQPGDAGYAELDARFNELAAAIRQTKG